MENNSISSSRTDKKTIERNRRNQMKALCSKLNSLLPHQSSRKPMSLSDQLDQAAKYIKKLQINLEKMRERKESLMGREERPPNSSSGSNGATMRLRYPQIKVHEIGSALEVVLITGLETQFMFNEIIRILHEEGAEIVNASFSVLDDVVFHTIHSKVGDSSHSYGAARISERLKKFVPDANPF
ncbi:transcription factor bHLH162 [Manihot esculenta]|uniref:BHLH domain-containing protein n=1 Tax=Manihot esculenta TaxID=3983 RepID=A0A2C9U8F7_MANES|nr:transcription factor bHLH162 [Manihot esculenta]OAY26202.1 hypothetical protein MANES_16G028800v8 [Manihot esculenta]